MHLGSISNFIEVLKGVEKCLEKFSEITFFSVLVIMKFKASCATNSTNWDFKKTIPVQYNKLLTWLYYKALQLSLC